MRSQAVSYNPRLQLLEKVGAVTLLELTTPVNSEAKAAPNES